MLLYFLNVKINAQVIINLNKNNIDTSTQNFKI